MDHKIVHPYGDHVLLRFADRKKSIGKIQLPENVKMSVWQSGEVIAIGPGIYDKRQHRIPIELQIGMQGVFRFCSDMHWESFKDENDGKTYILIRAPFIEFVMEETIAAEVNA